MSENTASAKAEEKAAPNPAGSSRKSRSSKASLNMDEIRELAELVNEHGFTDFEFENENIRIRLSKMTTAPVMQAAQPAPAPLAAAPVAPAPAEEPAAGEIPAGMHILTSPIVGTFYRSPSPEAPSYVEVGSRVRKGQTLCIIEAMKLMNEIESDADGTIIEIFVDNTQPVEYSQPLFGIKTDN